MSWLCWGIKMQQDFLKVYTFYWLTLYTIKVLNHFYTCSLDTVVTDFL